MDLVFVPARSAAGPEGRDSLELPAKDDGLTRATQEGDREAFTALVKRYWKRLYRWLYHLTRNQHAAEDLMQETFLKAFAGLQRFRAGTNFAAWLFRIAHNNFANHYRHTQRGSRPLPDDLPTRAQGPCEEAETRETMRSLAEAVARLPTDFRAALLLRVEEDLSFREIAEVMGLTEETARWRVFKARQKLLSVLAPPPERDDRWTARSSNAVCPPGEDQCRPPA
jgi:RNA polymerase sigma-70 factor (ECF subfamily)